MMFWKHSIVYKTFSYHYLTWLSQLCEVVIERTITIHLQMRKLRLEGKWLAPNHTAVQSSIWLVSWSHVLSAAPHHLHCDKPGWPCCVKALQLWIWGKHGDGIRIVVFWDLCKTVPHHCALIPNSTSSAPRYSFPCRCRPLQARLQGWCLCSHLFQAEDHKWMGQDDVWESARGLWTEVIGNLIWNWCPWRGKELRKPDSLLLPRTVSLLPRVSRYQGGEYLHGPIKHGGGKLEERMEKESWRN